MNRKRQRKYSDEETSTIDPSSREYIYDKVDDYNDIGKEIDVDFDVSDSENEFGEDAILTSKDKRKEQVLGLNLKSSDEDNTDDDDDDIGGMSDDIENSENENNDHEDRSMGRMRKDYYGTDITDQRLYNIGRKKNKKKGEDEALQIELEGAYELQNRFQAQKAELFDFDSEFADTKAGDTLEEELEAELNKSSSGKGKTKSKKAKKKTPIISSDFDDLAKEVCDELQSKLIPLIEALKNGILPESFDSKYLRTRYFLCLNFMTTYSAQNMLIAAKTDMEGHPVEKRLAHYKELFKTMESCRKRFESEFDPILKDLKSGKLKKKRKLLSILKPKEMEEEAKKKAEKTKEMETKREEEEMDSEGGDFSEEELEENDEGFGKDAEGKRLITYEIAKNKGLMPTRKKEDKNPRVKYKKKYQNKLKRRKGQVRQVRHEIKRYGGEISGINKNVIKSRTLK